MLWVGNSIVSKALLIPLTNNTIKCTVVMSYSSVIHQRKVISNTVQIILPLFALLNSIMVIIYQYAVLIDASFYTYLQCSITHTNSSIVVCVIKCSSPSITFCVFSLFFSFYCDRIACVVCGLFVLIVM